MMTQRLRSVVRLRCGLLSAAFLALLTWPAAAQTCSAGTITLEVDGKTLNLDRADVTRVPYGKDMTAWIAPPEGTRAREVVAQYRVTSRDRGVRTDLVAAQADESGECWAAGLEKLHLNESGTLAANLYLEPAYRANATSLTLVTEFLARLAAVPSGTHQDVYAGLARQAAEAAAAITFERPGEVVVVEGDPLVATPLADRLGRLVATEIELGAAVVQVQSDAQFAQEAAADLVRRGTARLPGAATCPVATSIPGLRDAAAALRNATAAEIRARIVDGRLPWAACALDLVRSIAPVSPADTSDLEQLEERTGSLVRAPRLARLAGVAAAAREVLEMAASLETMTVPFGADILERYTQVDLVSAYLWDRDLTQEFAAATWYFFTPGESLDFSAGIRPGAGVFAPDRWGLQVGYPVGAPITGEDEDPAFEPTVLLGLIGRINGILSLSGGWVIGRESGDRESPMYASLNLDLSNLGPLQQIFARRDPE